MTNNNLKWGSPKVIIGLVCIVLLTAIIIASILRDRLVNQPLWSVNVVGQGRVTYRPDIADVTLGVQVDKVAKAEDALQQLNEKMNKIFEALQQVGIPKIDIQTQNYTLAPQYDYVENVSRLAGYSANQLLTVKVRKINSNTDLITKVIAAATKSGVNQITSVAFETSKLNELKQAARLKAIIDAKSKAGDISRALGVKLVKIIGWWENVVYSPEGASYLKGDLGGIGGGGVSNPVVPSGSQEIVMEINLNYKIK